MAANREIYFDKCEHSFQQLPLADLLRQSVYSRLAGYEDVNDAQRLSQDPTFRLIGSEKIWERGAALTSRLPSFETGVLAQEENLAGLERGPEQISVMREAGEGKVSEESVGKAESFELWDSPRPLETPCTENSENWARALQAEAVRCTLPVVREIKMEIPNEYRLN